jgi:release factor glutamine methyltransferase
LAAYVLGIRRSELVAQPDLTAARAAAFQALIDRRANREPLQHITGVAHFRHNSVQVGPGVFIPRPETEVVAGAAIEAAGTLAATGATPVVVDLYAGSGAIAIAVAHEVRQAVVHAVEGDARAADWLKRNVADHTDGRLHAHHNDVAGCVDGALRELAGSVDVVVANPPYIPEAATIRDPEVAEFDPPPALWSGPDGLDAMRVLERVASRLLRPGGAIVAEHADLQGDAAPAIFAAAGRWVDVTDHRDLTDRPRYLTATRSAS